MKGMHARLREIIYMRRHTVHAIQRVAPERCLETEITREARALQACSVVDKLPSGVWQQRLPGRPVRCRSATPSESRCQMPAAVPAALPPALYFFTLYLSLASTIVSWLSYLRV